MWQESKGKGGKRARKGRRRPRNPGFRGAREPVFMRGSCVSPGISLISKGTVLEQELSRLKRVGPLPILVTLTLVPLSQDLRVNMVLQEQPSSPFC